MFPSQKGTLGASILANQDPIILEPPPIISPLMDANQTIPNQLYPIYATPCQQQHSQPPPQQYNNQNTNNQYPPELFPTLNNNSQIHSSYQKESSVPISPISPQYSEMKNNAQSGYSSVQQQNDDNIYSQPPITPISPDSNSQFINPFQPILQPYSYLNNLK